MNKIECKYCYTLKENIEFTTSQVAQKSPKCKVCVRNKVTKKDRICKQCNEVKPLKDFDDISHKCNECKNICKNRTEKKCSKCKAMKSIDEFSYSINSLDGKDSWCKACKRENKTRNRAYYEA